MCIDETLKHVDRCFPWSRYIRVLPAEIGAASRCAPIAYLGSGQRYGREACFRWRYSYNFLAKKKHLNDEAPQTFSNSYNYFLV